MAWTKTKMAIVAGVALLVTGTTILMTRSTGIETQLLADGSQLVLNRLLISEKNEFVHGSALEKLLGAVIPVKGAQLLGLKLSKPKRLTLAAPPGYTWLAAEFRLTSSNAANHPLVKAAFYPEFRCVIRGENGIEYAQGFWDRGFQSYADGYYGHIITSRFPRDSQWLWFRIERREAEGGPWTFVAEFKARNTAQAVIKPWVADPIHVAKRVKGMDFALGEITVKPQAYSPTDLRNHVVNTPFQVSSNGIALTNWGAPYIRVEDASGNWDYNLASHRSLDPRYVWKLAVDFQPESAFPPECVATLSLPPPKTTTTNIVMGQTITLSYDGSAIDVRMPTNRTDLALKYIGVTDAEGVSASSGGGAWNQHVFRKGSFFVLRDGVMHFDVFKPVTVTFAVVPNVHVEFLAQPSLATEQIGN